MASKEAFNYHPGLWLLMSHIILSQTCSKLRNDSIEDSEMEDHLEKIDFADLVKNTKSVTGFFFSCCQFVTLDQHAIGLFFKLMALGKNCFISFFYIFNDWETTARQLYAESNIMLMPIFWHLWETNISQ